MGATESFPYDDQPSVQSGVPPHTRTDGGLPIRRTAPNGPTPGKRPTRPLTRLSGALAGGPNVGKRTLIQRLLEVDPHDSSVDRKSIPTVVTIPYSPPPGMPTWNRIQLQVGRVNDATIPKVDFLVVLLRPDKPEQDLQEYTLHTIRQYMYHLGITSKRSALEVASVCICVMVNFQDLVTDKTDESKLDDLLKSLESFLAGVIRPFSIPADRVMLQVMSASVRNGHGLDRLHQFIYRTYLQKKRDALEAQLRAVTIQIKMTDDPTIIVSRNSDRFPEALATQDVAPPAIPQGHENREKPRLKQPTQDPGTGMQEGSNIARLIKQPDPTQVMKQTREEPTRSKKDNRRQIHTHISPTPRNGKDALEAFFANDSSDGEDRASKTKNVRETNNVKTTPVRVDDDDDDNDDDDSDFFYDESGNFKHANSPGDDDSTCSETSISKVHSISPVMKSEVSHPLRNKKQPSVEVLEPDEQKTSHTFDGIEASLSESSGSESNLDNPKPMNDDVREESVDVLAEQTHKSESDVSVLANTHGEEKPQEANGASQDDSEDTNDAGRIEKHPTPPSDLIPSSVTLSDDKTRSQILEPATDQTERTKASDKEGPLSPLASDTLDKQVATTPQSSNEEGDNGSDNRQVVIGGEQHCSAMGVTTSSFSQLEDDDSDDEDEFFVDQHQNHMSGATTRVGDSDDDDDDDEFFVAGIQATPSFEGVPLHSHNSILKAAKEASSPSDMNVHDGEKFNDDSRSDEEYGMGNLREPGEPSSQLESSATPVPTINMELSSRRPSTSGMSNSSAAVSQPMTTSIPTTSSGSGISAAALAAIQAAQRNAEAMLLLMPGANDASSQAGNITKKAKKIKKEKKMEKDGKKKKKKKKVKSQFVGDVVDVSD